MLLRSRVTHRPPPNGQTARSLMSCYNLFASDLLVFSGSHFPRTLPDVSVRKRTLPCWYFRRNGAYPYVLSQMW